ncbi:MAG: hypothetical protein GXO70_09195 [Acidobacteria bacterium]|nr:hypothetical protein [Acidobacteriota bacterium]
MTGRWLGKWLMMAGILTLMAVAGCVVQTGPKVLEKRVTAFWHAREAGTYAFKYNGKQVDLYDDFLSNETKKAVTQQQYYGQINLKVTNSRIDGIEYDKDGQKATVTIRFDTTFQIAKLRAVRTRQEWIIESGKWVLLYNPQRSPFRSWQ